MKAGKVVDQEKLFEDIGRMRSIEEGNDGFIYLGLENPGRVVRLRPLW
ncbi:MAG: PQQ-dependent sugar dehydrogenase [Saprospiraceae bacterium]|nr:PQQ-dependent sugar dehydrogenase [Saprospiraceae bacterium]